jgi:hypothetical protein
MKSFLQGKKSVAMESLRPPAQFAGAHAPGCEPARISAAATAAGASSHVEVVKEGDKVVRLIVHCACGERVEIDCLYSAGR